MSAVTWESLQRGEVPEPLTVGPISPTDIVAYQGASGDLNPLHHDDAYAQAAGFPRAFSVGMFQAGVVAAWAADWLGPQNVRSFRCRFKEMVFPGDTLTVSTAVTDMRSEGSDHLVDLELTCATQSGAVAVQAFATFVVP